MTLDDLLPEIRAWRHDLHAHPETAFEEHRTADRIATLLRHFGLEVREGVGRTGVIGTLRGTAPGRRIALRADMDALNLTEASELPYRSQNPGRMHACGHDGHSAMLLGAARILSAKPDLAGTIDFVFQPAEENEGGGRAMVEDGLFRDHPADAVFGMHNWPGLALGKIALRPGPMMAAYDIFEITLEGRGAHAAMPHLGRDVMPAAAQLVLALQTIPSRNIHPQDALVVSVTQIHGGDTWNVLPQNIVIRGTVRSFKAEVQDIAEARLREISAGTATAFGLQASVRYERRYPATVNHPAETQFAAAVATSIVGAENVDLDPQPSMGAEDFAFMLRERPGAYVWLGAGEGPGLHNPGYDFNDACLPIGIRYWVRLAETFLGKPGLS